MVGGRKREGQTGNLNALKHGFYSKHFLKVEIMDLVKAEDLQEEIGMLQVVIRRLVKMAGGGRRGRGILSQHLQLDRVGAPALVMASTVWRMSLILA
ncbi:unnamed protein product [marine sediment metagenome]|uniref:Uncharacterized protein n=1 Tax=marine sediment metagenome TaxID=412755 RepID=X1D085_9ZZZZ